MSGAAQSLSFQDLIDAVESLPLDDQFIAGGTHQQAFHGETSSGACKRGRRSQRSIQKRRGQARHC